MMGFVLHLSFAFRSSARAAAGAVDCLGWPTGWFDAGEEGCLLLVQCWTEEQLVAAWIREREEKLI